jgi:hypothetical protein
MIDHERDGLVPAFDFMEGCDAQASLFEHSLAKGAIELQAVTESAAADHAKPTTSQRVLTFSFARSLEDDDASLSGTPEEVFLDDLTPRHDSEEDVARIRVGYVYFHVVPALDEPSIQVAEVAVRPDAEHAHGE